MIFLLINPYTISAAAAASLYIYNKNQLEYSDCDYNNKKYIELGWDNYLRHKIDYNKKFNKVTFYQTFIWFLIIWIFGPIGQLAFRLYFYGIFLINIKNKKKILLNYVILVLMIILFNYPGKIIPAFILCFTTFWGHQVYYWLATKVDNSFGGILRDIIDFIFDLLGFNDITNQYEREENISLSGYLTKPYNENILLQLKMISNNNILYNNNDICDYDKIYTSSSDTGLSCEDDNKVILITREQYDWLEKQYNDPNFWYDDYNNFTNNSLD